MFCQHTENEEQAVSAVGDDGIRQYSMSGWISALMADQAADTQAVSGRFSINEVYQSTVIVGVNAKLTFAATERTGRGLRAKTVHTFLKNRFSGSFFPDKLAIDQVLSYHNSA